jgi:demethylmenaquinone methyltransferase/2-methoxy-6-polyprenyl-1,4-benzoquinol methylase
MLSVTQSFIKQSSSVGNIYLVGGDAGKIPFKNGFFDAIFFSFTLELFTDDEIPIILSECKRVISPGGRICVVSLSKCGKDTTIRSLYEWLHRKIPQWVDCRPIYVETAIRQAGFVIQKVNHSSLSGLPVEIVCAVKP